MASLPHVSYVHEGQPSKPPLAPPAPMALQASPLAPHAIPQQPLHKKGS